MKAGIIGVGDELVTGQVVDTNSSHLARELGQMGIEVIEHCTVGDDVGLIASEITRLTAQSDVLIVSGGLGPTGDDVTREGLAKAMRTELVLDEESLAHIQKFFRARNREMSSANQRQALLPVGTNALPNLRGTAPGICGTIGNCKVFLVPGVPHEMRAMFAEQIAPGLRRGSAVLVHRIIHTTGMGESDLAERISDLIDPNGEPAVGTRVADGLVSIRVTARGKDISEANTRAESVMREIKDRLADLVVGQDDETISSVIGALLGQRGATLVTAESCTGGLIGQMVTEVPGSSEYYLGGVVAYSNRLKRELLGVSESVLETHGAVSKAAAAAMAEGARGRLASQYAVSATGIAGPGGGTPDKPVGLVYIAVSGPGGTEVHRRSFSGDRNMIRTRAAVSALNYLRLRLLENRDGQEA